MKKLVFKQSISGHGDPTRTGDKSFYFTPEQVAEIEDDLAAAWVASGIAVWAAKDKPKAETAVAKKPETPEAPKAVAVEDTSKKEG